MSLHIQAKKGEIAETVLMPGDPLRAKWMAETFFENPTCYNEIRGMLGYTGLYKGKKISVQGSGMGIPSAMIYYHELINAYEVKNIVRVGTAGSYQKDVKIRDVVLAMSASTTSGINKERFKHMNYAPTANYELLMRAVHFAEQNNIDIKVGNVLSSDEFYEDNTSAYRLWAEYGVLCVEMETAALYTLASKFNIRALSILTISDSLVTGERASSEERETNFKEMVHIALSLI